MNDAKKLEPNEWRWRAWSAIRSAAARLQPYSESIDNLLDENVEWAASVSLDEVDEVRDAEPGGANDAGMALGQAMGCLMGIRAIALIVQNPQADSRGEIDADKNDAANAIGYLQIMLRGLADDDAVARWAKSDERLDAQLGSGKERVT